MTTIPMARPGQARVHVSFWLYGPDTNLVNHVPKGEKVSVYAREAFKDRARGESLLPQILAELQALRQELDTFRERFEKALR